MYVNMNNYCNTFHAFIGDLMFKYLVNHDMS